MLATVTLHLSDRSSKHAGPLNKNRWQILSATELPQGGVKGAAPLDRMPLMGSAVGSAGLSVFGSNFFLRSLAHFVISSRVPDVWNVGKPREPAEDPDSRPCSCRVLCCVCSPLNPYGEKMTTSPDTRQRKVGRDSTFHG